jgi:hypothetical protein
MENWRIQLKTGDRYLWGGYTGTCHMIQVPEYSWSSVEKWFMACSNGAKTFYFIHLFSHHQTVFTFWKTYISTKQFGITSQKTGTYKQQNLKSHPDNIFYWPVPTSNYNAAHITITHTRLLNLLLPLLIFTWSQSFNSSRTALPVN